MVKNLPANARDRGYTGSIPGLGRSPEEELANHSSILARIIPWIEEPGRLQSLRTVVNTGLELDETEPTQHAHTKS